MKHITILAFLLILSGTAMAQKPEKPKAASTPKDQAYLGQNPATITDSPDYHRTKKFKGFHKKTPAASAASAASGAQ